MKTLRTDPGAKRLMESLRNMGYDCSTAIADLVDNSIAADASEIYIDIIPRQDSRQDMIPAQEHHPASIVIADNGRGMSKEQLHEAMRFGTLQEYSSRDLGKYGLGMKTASLSQCRVLTVSSKAKSAEGIRPRRHCMRWDIDHVYKTNNWNLLVPEDNEFESWENKALNHDIASNNGTVVLWANLEESLALLSSQDIRKRERFLAHLIEEVSSHLRMVFHRFMQGAVTGHRKLNIYVCGDLLTPWDPFCREEDTREPDILRLQFVAVDLSGSQVEETLTVSPFILPREDEFSSQAAWKDASGPKNWNQQQGFYFYRNNRLLQAGGWSRIRTIDEHIKLLRVAIDFPGELDHAFSINITKMRASLPAEIRERVSAQVSAWAKIARSRYDEKPIKSQNIELQQPNQIETKTISPSPDKAEDGNTVYLTDTNKNFPPEIDATNIPEFLEVLSANNETKWEIEKLCGAILKILEAVSEGRISPKEIPLNILKKIYKNSL